VYLTDEPAVRADDTGDALHSLFTAVTPQMVFAPNFIERR
jgi:hypothetical protein